MSAGLPRDRRASNTKQPAPVETGAGCCVPPYKTIPVDPARQILGCGPVGGAQPGQLRRVTPEQPGIPGSFSLSTGLRSRGLPAFPFGAVRTARFDDHCRDDFTELTAHETDCDLGGREWPAQYDQGVSSRKPGPPDPGSPKDSVQRFGGLTRAGALGTIPGRLMLRRRLTRSRTYAGPALAAFAS